MRRVVLVPALLLLTFLTLYETVPGYSTPKQESVLKTAALMVGGTYGWGAYDPENRVFDCWNFATWVYHTALDEPGSVDHMIMGRRDLAWVYFEDHRVLHRGDLLFNGGGHTVGFHAGIYAGRGKTVEARGGSYGINYFDIRGSNRFDPKGGNGYRFCFYSLIVRLWLNPQPTFHYVYFDEPENFVIKGEKITLLVRYLAFPYLVGSKLKVEMLDYLNDEVLDSRQFDLDVWETRERNIQVSFETAGVRSRFVYFRARIVSGSTIFFNYDSKILKYTDIIG